jgi:aspartate racemase
VGHKRVGATDAQVEDVSAVASREPVLGLVVGVGFGAGVFYYERIAKALAEGSPGGLMLAHADLRRVLDTVRNGDIAGLTEYLNTMIAALANAGATFSAISSVTTHACISQLKSSSAIPVVSIFDSVKAELEKVPGRRIALFGTRYVMETDMFGSIPTMDIVRPTGAQVTMIDGLYQRLAVRGYGTADDREIFDRVGSALNKRESIDVILLAGTDLSMLYESQEPAFPSLDCSVVHIRTILGKFIKA